MNARSNGILAGMLAVQVAIGAAAWWPRDGGTVEASSLLDLTAADVTAIEVVGRMTDGKAPDPVRIEKRGPDGWVIASAWDYPADPKKVTDALDALTGLKVRAPIATTAASHAALKVGDAEYGRKVKVIAGDKTSELVIGAAASKSVHVRRAGENDVFVGSGMSEWTLGDKGRSYWDTALFDVTLDSVDGFTVAGPTATLSLTKAAEAGWAAVGAPEGAAIDQKKVEDLVRKATTLRMTDVVAGAPLPEHGFATGHRVSWTTSAEGQSTGTGGLVIGADLETSYAAVQIDGKPWVFKIPKTTATALRDASVASLAPGPAPAAPGARPPGAPPGMPPGGMPPGMPR